MKNEIFKQPTESERKPFEELEQLRSKLQLPENNYACPKCMDILEGNSQQGILQKCNCGYLMLDATDAYYRLIING